MLIAVRIIIICEGRAGETSPAGKVMAMAAAEQKLVLVIDDEESMRDSCRQVLEKAGWRVVTVPDGAAGLKAFQESAPDLVLIDVMMPGIDGMAVLSRIRQEDPEVATVVVTGYGSADSAEEAMKLGAYDFLAKPFTPAELRVVARRNLERRALFVENRRLMAERKRVRESLTELVSREWCEPLVAVNQYFEVLLDGLAGDLSSMQMGILLKMHGKTERLLGVSKEWLSISSLPEWRLADRAEQIDIALLLNEAAGFVAADAREQQVTVCVSVPEEVGRLEGDRRALLHVFVNLLSNAVRYNVANGMSEVRVRTADGEMVVEVFDTGRGIPDDCLPFVFDDFYRVRTPRCARSIGSGLGLSFVKKVVEAHGGSVRARSILGEGSVFTVRLPLKAADAARSASRSAGRGVSTTGLVDRP